MGSMYIHKHTILTCIANKKTVCFENLSLCYYNIVTRLAGDTTHINHCPTHIYMHNIINASLCVYWPTLCLHVWRDKSSRRQEQEPNYPRAGIPCSSKHKRVYTMYCCGLMLGVPEHASIAPHTSIGQQLVRNGITNSVHV